MISIFPAPLLRPNQKHFFLHRENTEVDISKFADATDLDQSSAINVYVESW